MSPRQQCCKKIDQCFRRECRTFFIYIPISNTLRIKKMLIIKFARLFNFHDICLWLTVPRVNWLSSFECSCHFLELIDVFSIVSERRTRNEPSLPHRRFQEREDIHRSSTVHCRPSRGIIAKNFFYKSWT